MNAPDAQTLLLRDTLINLASGLGVGTKDKSVHTQYVWAPLNREQLNAGYRGDWIARKVVDLPAQDSTREWRAWQAEDDQIEKLEETERKFAVQLKVKACMTKARLYGGAALVIGVDGNSFEPLDVEKVGKDDLKFLHVVTQHELTAGDMEWDVLSPWYGQPKWYERQNRAGEVPRDELKIHPSRIVRMIGCEIPDLDLQTKDIWGDSILQIVNDAVLATGTVAAGIATLVTEAKSDVIKIPDLSKHLSTNEYTSKLTARLINANFIKSSLNTRVMDTAEEWEQMQINFSTLPEVLKMYLLIASGAADIPATRMLGQSPAGLSATGESDIRNYYDRIASDQETMMTPTLAALDEILIRTTFGSRDEDIWYDWNSLWQLSDTEKADIAVKKANAFKVDVELGLISPEALRIGRENQLIEDKTYPGLEAALEEFPDEPLPTPEEEREMEMEMVKATAEAKAGAGAAGNVVPFGGKKPAASAKKKAVGDATNAAMRALLVDAWNELDHPRHPKGSPFGGMFALESGAGLKIFPAGAGAGADDPVDPARGRLIPKEGLRVSPNLKIYPAGLAGEGDDDFEATLDDIDRAIEALNELRAASFIRPKILGRDADWDENEHPRHAAGTDKGGEFAGKGGTAGEGKPAVKMVGNSGPLSWSKHEDYGKEITVGGKVVKQKAYNLHDQDGNLVGNITPSISYNEDPSGSGLKYLSSRSETIRYRVSIRGAGGAVYFPKISQALTYAEEVLRKKV